MLSFQILYTRALVLLLSASSIFLLCSFQAGELAFAQSCCEAQDKKDGASMPNDSVSKADVCESQVAEIRSNSIVMPRPMIVDAPDSPIFACADSATLGQFQNWQSRFSHPVMCPVYLCHGSCAMTDKPCTSISTSQILSLPKTPGLVLDSYLNLSDSCCVPMP